VFAFTRQTTKNPNHIAQYIIAPQKVFPPIQWIPTPPKARKGPRLKHTAIASKSMLCGFIFNFFSEHQIYYLLLLSLLLCSRDGSAVPIFFFCF